MQIQVLIWNQSFLSFQQWLYYQLLAKEDLGCPITSQQWKIWTISGKLCEHSAAEERRKHKWADGDALAYQGQNYSKFSTEIFISAAEYMFKKTK